jgi:hypothetical protein
LGHEQSKQEREAAEQLLVALSKRARWRIPIMVMDRWIDDGWMDGRVLDVVLVRYVHGTLPDLFLRCAMCSSAAGFAVAAGFLLALRDTPFGCRICRWTAGVKEMSWSVRENC